MKVAYCSAKCQEHAWNRLHARICRPFYYIAGKNKKDGEEGSVHDDDIEQQYRSLLREYAENPSGALLKQLENLYRQLTPGKQDMYADRHPCHDSEDPVTGDSLDSMPSDNITYMFLNGVKHCFSVDEMWKFVRNRFPFNRNTNQVALDLYNNPLSDMDILKIRRAVEERIAREVERVYEYQKDFEASIHNLIKTYHYTFDFSRLDPYKIGNVGYVADLFLDFATVRRVFRDFPVFERFARDFPKFWRDLVYHLDPQWPRGNETDELYERHVRERIAEENGREPQDNAYFFRFDDVYYRVIPENPDNIRSVITAYENVARQFERPDDDVEYMTGFDADGAYETDRAGFYFESFDMRIQDYIDNGRDGPFIMSGKINENEPGNYYFDLLGGYRNDVTPENPTDVNSVIEAYEAVGSDIRSYDEWTIYGVGEGGEMDSETDGFDFRRFRDAIREYIVNGRQGDFILEGYMDHNAPELEISIRGRDGKEIEMIEQNGVDYNEGRVLINRLRQLNAQYVTVTIEDEFSGHVPVGPELTDMIWEYITDNQQFGPWISSDVQIAKIDIQIE